MPSSCKIFARHLFDPRQLPCRSHDIDSLTAIISDLQDPFTDLEMFQISESYKDDLSNPFNTLTAKRTFNSL